MKKHLLFLALAIILSVGAKAQSITLSASSGLIPPDGSCAVSGLPTDADLTVYLYVKNTTSSTVSVMMKKVIIDTVTGTINSFCWGTNCYPPFVYESPEPVDIPAGETDSVSFSGHYEPSGISGTSIIRYTFFLRDNTNDSASTRIFFQAFPVGIQEIGKASVNSIYPNPADDHVSISYSVPTGSNSALVIRDIMGAVKYSVPVSGSGKQNISTSSLSSGFYFCSVETNGKAEVTKKVIVRH